jgi:hypothetical protein
MRERELSDFGQILRWWGETSVKCGNGETARNGTIQTDGTSLGYISILRRALHWTERSGLTFCELYLNDSIAHLDFSRHLLDTLATLISDLAVHLKSADTAE